MRKTVLTVVGLVGLSLLLCGSGEALAQAGTTDSPAGGADASQPELWQSVGQLQGEVAQLRLELAQVRAELDRVSASMGVGGSGQQGEAVVNALYTGEVRSVTGRQLVLLDDSGQPFTVEVGDQTRFIRDGQRISSQQLKPGTRVRATVDLLSERNQATEVTTLPAR